MRKQLAQEQAREMRESAAQQIVDENEAVDPYENLNYIQPLPNDNNRRNVKKIIPKKIGKRKKRQQISQEEMSYYTANSASRVFQNNMGDLF